MENCGLFGVHLADGGRCFTDIFYGIFKLQHRGQRYCGIATRDRRFHLVTHRGYVRHTFTPAEGDLLRGHCGIGHASLRERQPVMTDSRLGLFSLAFSGQVTNEKKLFAEMKSQGHAFTTRTQVELLARIVAQGTSFTDGLSRLAGRVRGSWAVLVLTADGIYAARDPRGYKPLVIGRRGGDWAVSSESRPFQLTGFEIVRDVLPGEIVLLNRAGLSRRALVPSPGASFCAFEWGYVASMDSVLDGVPVVRVRNELGRSLARRNTVRADLVSAVPFSGVGYALGYHQESCIPYDEAFLFDRFSSRSYLPLSQPERELEARIKLSVVPAVVRNRRVVLCDDSIVRGTQIREKVRELKKAGAREVHVRVGCPPLYHACRYGVSTRSYHELVARRHSVEEIRRMIGADSLVYNTLDDLVAAIGLPREKLCLACWRPPGGKTAGGRVSPAPVT